MIARVREVDIAANSIHGLNRRPSRADRTAVDPALLEAWTAANRRAALAYRARLRWVDEHDRREAAADRAEAS